MKNLSVFIFINLFLNYSVLYSQTVFGPEQVIFNNVNGTIEPNSLFSADIDGDGDLDLLSTSNGDGKLAWYENIGDGNFSNQKLIHTALGANSVLSGDIDNDGDIDIVSAFSSVDQIIWFQNDGNGNFSNEVLITSDADGPISIFLADLNNDGDLDLLSASSNDGKIAWYKNDGSGNFSSQILIFNFGHSASKVFATDIDNDADLDIVFYSKYFGKIYFSKNDGEGVFSNEIEVKTFIHLKSVHPVDIDADGDLDFIINYGRDNSENSNYPKKVVYLINEGNDNFSEEIIISNISNFPEPIFIIDFDNDSKKDILGISSSNVSWYKNLGSGLFSDEQNIVSNNQYSLIYCFDVDMDENLEIVLGSYNLNKIVWHNNEGNGIFSEQNTLTTYLESMSAIYPGDLDGDNDIDLVTASKLDNKISWLENFGNNEFSEPITVTEDALGASSVYISDLDNDGDNDIISASQDDDDIAWYRNESNEGFSEKLLIFEGAYGVRTVFASDLDGDGLKDVVHGSFNTGRVLWNKNNGDGSFGNGVEISNNANGVIKVTAFDLDNDLDNDIIVASLTDNKISIFQNNGNGSFGNESIISSNLLQINTFDIIDLDNDGEFDIVTGSEGDDKIAWFKNLGGFNFDQEIVITTEAKGIVSLNTSDFNNDGNQDILLTQYEFPDLNSKLSYYLNEGNGTFSNQTIDLNADSHVTSAIVADLDDDGDFEPIISTFFGAITFYENLLGEELTTISGQIYWDKNEDSNFNNEDQPFAGINLTMQPDGYTFFTNEFGEFTALTQNTGTHNLTVSPPAVWDCEGLVNFEASNPLNANYTFEFEAFSTLQQDFVFTSQHNNCAEINGFVFNDENSNGDFDTVENGLDQILVNGGNLSTFTAEDGSYYLSISNDQANIISLYLNDSVANSYCEVSPIVYSQTFPLNNEGHTIVANSGNLTNLNFGVLLEDNSSFDVGLVDLVVDFGEDAGELFVAWMQYETSGILSEGCKIRLTHDPNLVLTQSIPSPTSVGVDYVEWVLTELDNFEYNILSMEWYLDSTMSEGDYLHWEAVINCPPEIDICPENDSLIRDIEIISGPLRTINENVQLQSKNLKGIMPEIVKPKEDLSYLITFSNPLKTTAYNVTIVDTLPDELDFSTISPPFSSFPNYDFHISEDGIIRIELDGINLSNAEEDEIKSYGFVQFNVRLKEELPGGTIIPNHATVYFNGIEPLQTNEVVHRLDVSSASVNTILNNIQASVFPNPFSHETTFKLNEPLPFSYDLRLVDILGREITSYINLSSTSLNIQNQNLPPGLYLLNLYEKGKQELLRSYKLIIE